MSEACRAIAQAIRIRYFTPPFRKLAISFVPASAPSNLLACPLSTVQAGNEVQPETRPRPRTSPLPCRPLLSASASFYPLPLLPLSILFLSSFWFFAFSSGAIFRALSFLAWWPTATRHFSARPPLASLAKLPPTEADCSLHSSLPTSTTLMLQQWSTQTA